MIMFFPTVFRWLLVASVLVLAGNTSFRPRQSATRSSTRLANMGITTPQILPKTAPLSGPA